MLLTKSVSLLVCPQCATSYLVKIQATVCTRGKQARSHTGKDSLWQWQTRIEKPIRNLSSR
ncbi:hypothetical protein D3C81_1782680 [compost metagenome]